MNTQETQRAAETNSAEYVLQLREITKRYGGAPALDGVDFDLRPGEVHALLGENGAGKSTLCKVLTGAVVPDSGELLVQGNRREYTHPSESLADGINMVYQETSLVPTMSVAQNLVLGHEKLINRMRAINISARQELENLNFHVSPQTYVSALSGAQRQMVEIVRALGRDSRVIIFDEPTTSLTPEEKEQLFSVIERLKERGVGIIFVSHALEESLQISDRITVLRDGKLQGTRNSADVTREDIVRMMVGRSVEYKRQASADKKPHGDPILRVENLSVGRAVSNMSFSAYGGEVLGIAGLVGAGRTETALTVSGALKRDRVDGGKIYLNGKPVRYRVPRNAVKDGIAYITEDRKVNGFFETMTIGENIYLGHLTTGPKLPWIQRRREGMSVVQALVDRFKIRAVSSQAKVIELSGGNQQKVVLAKSLTHERKVVIFDEPTRGVDVGAIEEIHQLIREIAESGAAVIVLSSYLPEIMALSDRILVAKAGRIAAEFTPEEATEERIMFAAVH